MCLLQGKAVLCFVREMQWKFVCVAGGLCRWVISELLLFLGHFGMVKRADLLQEFL